MKDLNISTLNDMLGALSTRKRPCDMENILNHEVFSEGRGEHVKIGDMALEHLLRKFFKILMSKDKTEMYHDLHAKIAKLDELLEEKDEIIDKFAEGYKDRQKKIEIPSEDETRKMYEKAASNWNSKLN